MAITASRTIRRPAAVLACVVTAAGLAACTSEPGPGPEPTGPAPTTAPSEEPSTGPAPDEPTDPGALRHLALGEWFELYSTVDNPDPSAQTPTRAGSMTLLGWDEVTGCETDLSPDGHRLLALDYTAHAVDFGATAWNGVPVWLRQLFYVPADAPAYEQDLLEIEDLAGHELDQLEMGCLEPDERAAAELRPGRSAAGRIALWVPDEPGRLVLRISSAFELSPHSWYYGWDVTDPAVADRAEPGGDPKLPELPDGAQPPDGRTVHGAVPIEVGQPFELSMRPDAPGDVTFGDVTIEEVTVDPTCPDAEPPTEGHLVHVRYSATRTQDEVPRAIASVMLPNEWGFIDEDGRETFGLEADRRCDDEDLALGERDPDQLPLNGTGSYSMTLHVPESSGSIYLPNSYEPEFHYELEL